MPEASSWVNPLPVRRVQRGAESTLSDDEWPATLAPVAQLLRDGIDLGRAIVLVGENGTGKSTIVEAIAMAFGLGAEGGSTGARSRTWSSDRFNGDGFFVMDEPEAGLSFQAQLALVGSLARLASQRGTQVVVATHSPIIANLAGATILELDDDGFHESTWADLAVVEHYLRYLEAPERYLRHLVD